MKPSVSRNQRTVSANFGVISTPWPMRLTCAGPLRQPHQLAGARERILAGVELLARLDRRCGATGAIAVHDLDLVAVRLGQPHPLAAARLVDRLDRRGARRLRQPVQVVLARRVVGEADEFRIALLGDVDVVQRIAAAHVERRWRCARSRTRPKRVRNSSCASRSGERSRPHAMSVTLIPGMSAPVIRRKIATSLSPPPCESKRRQKLKTPRPPRAGARCPPAATGGGRRP